jgi:aminomethyltransferase
MNTSTLKQTPLYDEHVRLKGRMIPFTGYALPVQYTGIVDEHHAVRKAVGLFDVSHMGELVVRGSDALAAVDRLVTNDMRGLLDGQARYTVCCNTQGTILDDLIVYRVSATQVLIVCNASNREKIVAHFTDAITGAKVEDISDDTALLALQGPRAMELLLAVGVDARVAEMPAFHFVDAKVFNVPCTVSRTGYTGEDGVEIFCPPGEAVRIWRGLLQAGEAFGVKPAGLGARNTLRLECRMALYGNDIDESTNPLEAGLGWTVKFEKGDFVGREALLAVKAKGTTRRLVGFEVLDKTIVRDRWDVLDATGQKVGYVTSGSPSPTLGKNIGLAYVPEAMAATGTQYGVRDPERGRTARVVVVKTPFYKRVSSASRPLTTAT